MIQKIYQVKIINFKIDTNDKLIDTLILSSLNETNLRIKCQTKNFDNLRTLLSNNYILTVRILYLKLS